VQADPYLDEDEDDDEEGVKVLLPLLVVIALGLLLGAVYAVVAPRDSPDLGAISPPASSLPSPLPTPQPSPQPSQEPSPSAAGATPTASLAPTPQAEAARVEDFLAPGAAPGPTPTLSLRVQGPDDLSPLGKLAPYVWEARRGTWELSKEPGGYIGLRSLPKDPAGVSVGYFELRRGGLRGSLSARVTVEVDADQRGVSGGLIYGRTDLRDYYLIGISHLGTRFVKHRTPGGIQDRLSGSLQPGPHSFGVNEEGGRLSISVDGRAVMGLGGAADPEARVGVFVLGAGLVKARDFEFELR